MSPYKFKFTCLLDHRGVFMTNLAKIFDFNVIMTAYYGIGIEELTKDSTNESIFG